MASTTELGAPGAADLAGQPGRLRRDASGLTWDGPVVGEALARLLAGAASGHVQVRDASGREAWVRLRRLRFDAVAGRVSVRLEGAAPS